MLKKIIFLIIILAVFYFIFKPFGKNTKVLGISTEKMNIPPPVQGILNSVSDSVINAAIDPLISQINNLSPQQKDKVKQAICK